MRPARSSRGLIVAVAQRGLDAVILRPRAIFGETDTALLPRLLRVARRGYLPLIDGGRAIVDLTYVENAADALIAAAIRPQGFSGEAFNISNGEPVAIRDLFARIAHGLGLQVRTISIPFRFGLPLIRRPGIRGDVATRSAGTQPHPIHGGRARQEPDPFDRAAAASSDSTRPSP